MFFFGVLPMFLGVVFWYVFCVGPLTLQSDSFGFFHSNGSVGSFG